MADEKPKKEKVPPVQPKPPPDETVWVACRAKAGCPGQQAKVIFRKKTPGGGSTTRYRCMACGGSFHIST